MSFFTAHSVVKYFQESLWRDEAFSWAMASRGLGSVALTAKDFNPPLYYLLLNAWMRVAGTSEGALRLLSLLCCAVTIVVVWRFMTEVLAIPWRRAAMYLPLFVLNPMLGYYATEARMYSMFALMAATSFYAYQTRRPVLYVVSTTAGLYTHYFMVFVVLAQLCALAFEPRSRRRMLVLTMLPPLLFAPWVIFVMFTPREPGLAFWIEPIKWRFAPHVLTSLYTGHDAAYGFLTRAQRWLFVAVLMPALLWTLWQGYRHRDRRVTFFVFALWALLPPVLVLGASLAIKPVYLPRYLIFSTVGLLLLFVYGLERSRPIVRLLWLAALMFLAVDYQQQLAARHTKGRLRETISEIRRRADPADVLYVTSELDFFPAEYYFGTDNVFVLGREYADIAPFTGKVLIPRERVLDHRVDSSRAFFLKSDREYVESATAP